MMLQWIRKINNHFTTSQPSTSTQKPSPVAAHYSDPCIHGIDPVKVEITNEVSEKIKAKRVQRAVKALAGKKDWQSILALSNWYLKTHQPYSKQYSFMGKAELQIGSPLKAITYFQKALETDYTRNNLMALFQAQKICGDWQSADKTILEVIENFKQDDDTPIETQNERMRGSADFLRQSAEISQRYPQPQNPKGVVIYTSYACEGTIGLNLLATQQLKQDGYAVIHIYEGMLPQQKTGIDAIDSLHGIIHYQKNALRGSDPQSGLFYNWSIDWDKKIVEAEGINFYQSFFERLARDLHRYSIKMDNNVEPYFKSLLQQADVALYVARKIEDEICNKMSLPVRCVSGSSQYVPYGIFRTYCRERGRKNDMEFISTLIGKEYNFFNRINERSNFVSTRNVTAYSDVRMPQLPPRQTFERWTKNNPITDAEKQFSETFVNHDRNLTGKLTAEGQDLLQRLSEEKTAGRPIVCIFGKVIWDFDYPHDHGPAHNSLEDWISHTIDAAKNSSALFLIKPHPHEEMKDISGVPNERFIDLLPDQLPENVLLLGGDWVNTRDLIPYLDLGVVWAGTVELDLGINGVPVLACSDWGQNDYPIGFSAPKNKDDYEKLLCHPKAVAKPVNCEERCVDLLRYMASDEILVPYHFYRRSTTNAFIIPKWYSDDLETYYAEGNKHVDLLARRFFQDRPEHPA